MLDDVDEFLTLVGAVYLGLGVLLTLVVRSESRLGAAPGARGARSGGAPGVQGAPGAQGAPELQVPPGPE